MRIKRILYIVGVLILATIASTGTYQIMRKTSNESTTVFAADTDIPASTVLTSSEVKAESFPGSSYPGSSPDPVGKVSTVGMVPGEVVMDNMLSSTTSFGLAFQVPMGMYAIAIPISNITGVSGAINPGNNVDIIATTSAGVRQDILANILVLAKTSDTLTLEVSQDAALTIDQAELRGSLDLILRGEQ